MNVTTVQYHQLRNRIKELEVDNERLRNLSTSYKHKIQELEDENKMYMTQLKNVLESYKEYANIE